MKIKILFVMDEYFANNNGMSISAQRFARELRLRGHQVRVLAGNANGTPDFPLEEYVIPVFDGLIKKQGTTFAKAENDMIRRAVSWADVVYIESPFVVAARAAKEAARQGKACTGGFHLYPENITSSLHLVWSAPVNNAIFRGFRNYVYQYCSDIHCPTRYVEQRLVKHGYDARLHVISNGVPHEFAVRKAEKPAEYQDKFVILSIGRYSVEKRQDLLIQAVMKSGRAREIQLIFAGQGPLEQRYKRLARNLPNPPVFRFMEKRELIDTIAYSDLYVHTADAEVEGMSALEAISGGLVPVISDSAKSSTKQLALDGRSLFTAGDPASLKRRILYWMDQPEERERMAERYRRLADQYSVADSAAALERMFSDAYEDTYGCEEEAL